MHCIARLITKQSQVHFHDEKTSRTFTSGPSKLKEKNHEVAQ